MFERFVVHTNHPSLQWLLQIKPPSGLLMRGRLRLEDFDLEVIYIKGKLNTGDNFLYHLETLSNYEDDIPSFLPESTRQQYYEQEKDFLDVEYADVDKEIARRSA